MSKKIIFLPSSNSTQSNDFKDILNKYIHNLKSPMEFSDDILHHENRVIVNRISEVLINIHNEIKELLVMKLVLKEKDYELDEDINDELLERIKNEVSLSNDNIMNELYVECDDDFDTNNLLEVATKMGISLDKSIINSLQLQIYLKC